MEQEARLKEANLRVQELIGKTVLTAYVVSHKPDCDASNLLVLQMSDGSVFEIEGGYGGYSGDSCDEFIELISIRRSSTLNHPQQSSAR